MESERSEDGKLMANILQATWRKWIGRGKREVQVKPKRAPHAARMRQLEIPAFDIAPQDPIMAHLLSTPGGGGGGKLKLDRPALEALKAEGVTLGVPPVR